MESLTARFVAPFYLRVLHGNLVAPTSEGEEAVLITEMKSVSREVTVEICQELWPRGWREGLMASWWGGVWRWPEVVGNVEPLLIPSRSTYEGQGHCFALSRVATDQAVAVLKRYLDEYLPRTEIYYDQVWAMAALVMVEREGGAAVADRYWDMWQAWVADKPHDLTSVTETLDRMHHFADRVAGG